jgi:capsular exopolysaccharide synthesis family protein
MQKLESRLWTTASKEGMKVVLFTSPLDGEGKSTTVAYLSTALALHKGRRILAIDLDLRRPRLNRHFGLEESRGLGDILRKECSLDEAVIQTEVPGLHVLLPGSREVDPQFLLSAPDLTPLFDVLRERYDLILLDVPALLPVADAVTLIPFCDGVVLVVMAGKTTRPHLTRTREIVMGMGARILGIVIGNIKEAAPEYFDPSYYYAHASPLGTRNGGDKDGGAETKDAV